jgi:hypothetical protein
VAVGEGSAIEGIEIQLVRGAVITGKVTGADGNRLSDGPSSCAPQIRSHSTSRAALSPAALTIACLSILWCQPGSYLVASVLQETDHFSTTAIVTLSSIRM